MRIYLLNLEMTVWLAIEAENEEQARKTLDSMSPEELKSKSQKFSRNITLCGEWNK